MNSSLGRLLLIGLIVLVAIALVLLTPQLLNLVERTEPSPTVSPARLTDAPATTAPAAVPATTMPTATATPTATSSPTPAPSPTPQPTATPLPDPVGYTAHVAAAGETLEQIAQQHDSFVAAIASLNRLSPEPVLAAGQPLVIPLYAGQGLTQTVEVRGLEVERGLPGRRVALTFDAGASSAPALSILDTLKQYDVQVTFFLTGRWAEENPDLVRRIAADGHELANHTYSHPHLTGLDEDQLQQEVARTEEIIHELVGQTTRPFLRPPFGDRNQRVLDLLAWQGYVSIYWTVDSLDSVGEPKTADFLLSRVTNPTTGGGTPIALEGAIILMHVGNESTAEALPSILQWFRQNNWQVVKVSEILQPLR